jgi:hypothetical protein
MFSEEIDLDGSDLELIAILERLTGPCHDLLMGAKPAL